MKSKKEIRSEILSMRRQLSTEQVTSLSRQICDRFISNFISENYCTGSISDLCLYSPINKEVDAMMLCEYAWEHGLNVWLPKVTGDEMEFVSYQKGASLITGAFNILEPEHGAILEPNSQTVVIMPGAAFSVEGDRIGYGGGYYDKYLEKHLEVQTVAFCYDFQIVDRLPSEAHDIRPNAILSEERIIRSREGRR
jgi:5-formyltetrahydrofolate cyclo-ligase